jgi:hypothetical protein
MGLLESLINVPEQLRIWHLSGVRYLLLPEVGEGASPVESVAPDPSSWPPAWAALFAKTPRQPRLCISYASLGFDLTGRSDSRRGALWRRLITDLDLAGRGLVAFWPPGLPDGDTLVWQPTIFREALSLLQPNVLAFFGDPATCTLPFDTSDAQPTTIGGIRCVLLPDPETLLAGDQEIWDHVLGKLGQS